MDEKKHIFSVSELTRNIKSILEGNFPGIWIEGEISNYKLYPSSGHRYFTLKDENSQLRAVFFRNSAASLKFEPKDGMAVICFGRISVYEVRGEYQIKVEKIEPKGVGALQLAFEQLKEKLAKEGLFDERHKKPIPALPLRIGVVTSPSGAAIRDILKVVYRRFANVEILINPAPVQGKEAAPRIAEAIDELNKIENVDVLIVGRGGGSLEDLWAFNEEIVARAIFRSKIPVISAVGHEIDTTIADFTSDLRAPTPSAAAELVIKEKRELKEKIEGYLARMRTTLSSRLEAFAGDITQLAHRLRMRNPLRLVDEYRQRLDDLSGLLSSRIDHFLELRKLRLKAAGEKLETLGPLNILKRGYSITTLLPGDKIIRDAREVKIEDRIKTILGEGELVSKVKEKKDGRD